MFEFYRYKKGDGNSLYAEKRIPALSGYAIYLGEALQVSGGLCAATTGALVYGISNVSVASSVATASFIPEVFPVNDDQIWKGTFSTAVTAATSTIISKKVNVEGGTGIDGNNIAGTAAYLYDVTTGSSPLTSACYVIFAPLI